MNSTKKMNKVAVVGAGVIGLSSAVVLQRRMPWLSVTLIAERFSPDTTGDGSAGLWEPYLLNDTPPQDILRWAGRTYKLFLELWRSPMAGEAGVCLVPAVCVTQEETFTLPEWKNYVMGFQELSKKHLEELAQEHSRPYTGGYNFVSFTCEPTKFLPMLLKEFKQRGGIVREHKISLLSELQVSFDVVVNCTGLQARFVVPDLNVKPIRGQVMRAKAPWIYHLILDDSPNGSYIIPNIDTVVLGGTRQDDWNLDVDPQDSQRIHSECCKMVPSLKAANIIREWVGLRPGRNRVRLERETRHTSRGAFEVVHNYGHGGSGVTLCWGCAEEAADLVAEVLQDSKPKPKL